jgi:uncharacterized membrane protein YsdA (DUF1294 family)
MTLNHFCYLLLGLAALSSAFFPYSSALWFVFINVLTLIIYGADKLAARKARRRVPEFTLLIYGLVGGWPGAILGQQLFRHKTQKQPFKTYFFISVMLNIVILVAIYRLIPY